MDNCCATIRVGSGCIAYRDPWLPQPLVLWYHAPHTLQAKTPIVFVLHGTRRDAQVYRDTWATAARSYGFLLLCPEFGSAAFPGRAYQQGGVFSATGVALPQERWTFSALDRIFAWVKGQCGNITRRYAIYGHSAGAQFVHRMVLLLPEAHFHTAIAANAGWYTLPTFRQSAFPYSLKGSPGTPETLARAFGRSLHLLLGERDVLPDDPHLRRSTRAQQQGANRLARGHSFYYMAQIEAERLGVALAWRLQTVPAAGHSDAQMLPAALEILTNFSAQV